MGTFTSAPAPILERLGIVPHSTVRLRLANGQIEERQIGDVTVEPNDERQAVICVFGAPGDPPVIGAHTLEGFLLGVDPVESRLVPVIGWWV